MASGGRHPEREESTMAKRFVVDLGNVELAPKDLEAIEASIQQAALSALATVDFRGDLIARFPREWLGIWIDLGKGLPIDDGAIAKFAPRG